MSSISFSCKNQLGDSQYELVIKGLFKNESVNSFFNQINVEKINNIIKLEDFQCEFNKSIDSYGLKNILRIGIVGLGDKKKITSDKIRSIASNIIRKYDEKKIKSQFHYLLIY